MTRAFDDRDTDRNRLGQRHIDVLSVERVRGAEYERDGLSAGSDGPLISLHVGNQRFVVCPVDGWQTAKQLAGVGHLRHGLWRDKAGRFERPDAGGDKSVEHRELAFDRHDAGLVLQPVSQPNFINGDALTHSSVPPLGSMEGANRSSRSIPLTVLRSELTCQPHPMRACGTPRGENTPVHSFSVEHL